MLQRALSKRWVVFLTTVVMHGLATRGRALMSSDTALYVKLADGFTTGNFSQTFNLGAVRWTKSLYLFLLAAARAVSPGHWQYVMVALNILCSGVIAVLIVELARRASRSVVMPLVALLLYLTCYEVLQWLPFVLTDLMFTLTALLPFYLVARRILDPNEPLRPFLLVLSLLVAAFTRPPGAVLIPLVLFAELVLVQRRVRLRTAMILIVLIAAVALFVRTAVVHDPARWPFAFVKPKVVEFSGREKTGEVVMDRKETYRPAPATAMDHVVIQADRFARFFQFTSSAYSRAHNLINLVYFVPLYLLGLIAAIHGLRTSDERRRAFVIALLTWIGVFAFFYALTVLDFDWRFRTPFMPHFILLAACGADVLIARRRGA